MHLINCQVTSKDIDDFMNQFLRKKKKIPSHTIYIAPHFAYDKGLLNFKHILNFQTN
jgi:hypothetical protein